MLQSKWRLELDAKLGCVDALESAGANFAWAVIVFEDAAGGAV